MRRFFDLTFLPFFVFTGATPALGAVNAFWPRWAVEKIVLIPFNEDYTIILQHWGFMLGLMGVFMIIAAFSAAWRYPTLIFCAHEKAFTVYLIAVNWKGPYARCLWGRIRDGCSSHSIYLRILNVPRLYKALAALIDPALTHSLQLSDFRELLR